MARHPRRPGHGPESVPPPRRTRTCARPSSGSSPPELDKIERFFVKAAPCMPGFRADLEALAAA